MFYKHFLFTIYISFISHTYSYVETLQVCFVVCLQHVQQSILDILTPDDVRHLTESIDEDSRKGGFQRVFPTPSSHKYLKYFETPRYYNLLLNQWVQRYNKMEHKGKLTTTTWNVSTYVSYPVGYCVIYFPPRQTCGELNIVSTMSVQFLCVWISCQGHSS